jgi:hypothetical protein
MSNSSATVGTDKRSAGVPEHCHHEMGRRRSACHTLRMCRGTRKRPAKPVPSERFGENFRPSIYRYARVSGKLLFDGSLVISRECPFGSRISGNCSSTCPAEF